MFGEQLMEYTLANNSNESNNNNNNDNDDSNNGATTEGIRDDTNASKVALYGAVSEQRWK